MELQKLKEQLNKILSGKITGTGLAAVFVALFLFLTAGFGVYSFIAEDREFSDSENRVLADVPSFSINSLLSGEFMKDFESYLADQFPLRDEAISLKTFIDRLFSKREENGVLIGGNGYLFDAQTPFDEAANEDKLRLINEFSEKYVGTKQLIAISPNSSYINSESLPYNKRLPDQSVQIDRIYASLKSPALKKLDTVSILEAEKERGTQLYYKTDHHWTTRGAFSVFRGITEQWKLDEKDIRYTFHPVATDFEGTLSSKAGVHDITDTVEICVPEDENAAYVVSFESQQKKTASLFAKEKLTQKNKYEVFLGGNYDKVIITTLSEDRNTLLIVKDSYANCMLPMLSPHFSKIIVVDPRYMTESIHSVMEEYDITHVLFLYNLNTFLEDTSIVPVFMQKEEN